MERAYIYARVSSAGQNTGVPGTTSLDFQVHECTQFAERNNLSVIDTYQEIGSARDVSKLSELQSLVNKVVREGTVSVVIFYDVSRFTRDLLGTMDVFRRLTDKGRVVKFVSATDYQNYTTGEWTAHMGGHNSNFINAVLRSRAESDMISQRVRSSIAIRRASGHIIGPAPFGKMKVANPQTGGQKLVNFPEEQKVLKTLHDLRKKGMSYSDIADEMDTRRIRYRGKRPFTANIVRRLIVGNKQTFKMNDMLTALP